MDAPANLPDHVLAELRRPAALRNAADGSAPVQDDVLETLVLPLQRSDDGWLRVEYQESVTSEWRFGWLTPADAREIRVGQERSCPRADASHVLSMDATDGPACFGNRELALAPVFLEQIVPKPDAAYEGEPAWLARIGDLVVSAHPGGDAGSRGSTSRPRHGSPRRREAGSPSAGISMTREHGPARGRRSANRSSPRHPPSRCCGVDSGS